MNKINWGRLVLGGLIASALMFVTDGLLHEKILGEDWKAVAAGLHLSPEGQGGQGHNPLALLYFVLFDLGRGFTALIVYVMMRARLGAGPKTATLAALVSWMACCITTPAEFIPLGFYSVPLLIKAGAFQLVTSIAFTLAGAAVYKESTPAKA